MSLVLFFISINTLLSSKNTMLTEFPVLVWRTLNENKSDSLHIFPKSGLSNLFFHKKLISRCIFYKKNKKVTPKMNWLNTNWG